MKGINTAANLWISAAISMAIGADLWEIATITSVFTCIVLFVNNRYKKCVYKKKKEKNKNNNIELSEISNLDRDPLDEPYDYNGEEDE